METQVKKTSTTVQMISTRMDAEKRKAIEKLANEKGYTLAEYMRILVEGALQNDAPKTSASENMKSGSSAVGSPATDAASDRKLDTYIRQLSDKADTTNELLGKLVELQQPSEDAQSYTDEEISKMLADAIVQEEERLRGEHLMIRMTPDQKKVILNLLSWRQESKEKHSANIEEMFFFLVKEKFCGFLANRPEGFEKEFFAAFNEQAL